MSDEPTIEIIEPFGSGDGYVVHFNGVSRGSLFDIEEDAIEFSQMLVEVYNEGRASIGDPQSDPDYWERSKDGWRTRYLTPQERATLSEAFRTSGKLVAVLSLPERENPPAIKDSGRAL